MRILVTGATGFLGQNLVKHLLLAGESVRVLVRSSVKAQPLGKLGAEIVEGDIADRSALTVALRDRELVYHLAGRLFEAGAPAGSYHATHVAGTQALLECAEAAGQVTRLVHASTTGVIGAPMRSPQDEDAPIAPTNAYEQAKWEGEKLVRDAIGRGFPAVIVRPGLVYGPGDLHLLGFFRTIQRGLFRPIGPQPVWLHPIFIDDMVLALTTCGGHPRAVGECFNIANPVPLPIGDLAGEIANALGEPLPAGTIPLQLARMAAGFGDLLPPRLKGLAPLTTSRLDFLTQSRMYNVSRAERILGFRAETPVSTGIAQAVAWYRSEGYL